MASRPRCSLCGWRIVGESAVRFKDRAYCSKCWTGRPEKGTRYLMPNPPTTGRG